VVLPLVLGLWFSAFGSRPLVLGLGIAQADVARDEASHEGDTLLFAAQKKKHSNIS
jgi:hypothetical protein